MVEKIDARVGEFVNALTRIWAKQRLRRTIAVVVAIVFLASLIFLVVEVPRRHVETATDVSTPSQLVALENEIRRTWATIAAGVSVMVSGFLTWLNVRVAQENLRVTQDGQITDRFNKAIEQLGATHGDGRPHIEVRLGGIYSLERIAQDSPARDHWTIMEVLAAYVREHAPVSRAGEGEDAVTNGFGFGEDNATPRPRIDVQAVLTVLGRRSEAQLAHERGKVIDLSGTDLRGADLGGATLARANLERADLRKASLALANLQEGNLKGAKLEGAILEGANLEGANLQRANLLGVTGLTQDQLDKAVTDECTILPEELAPDGKPLRRSTRKPPA